MLDRDVLVLEAGRVLVGGNPGRLLRLGAVGTAALDRLAAGQLDTAAVRELARTLVEGGLAHPRPPPAPVPDVTVVVPVRDRTAELHRCLAALGQDVPVLVVDDGSLDPTAVAAVCGKHRAQVLHLPVNVGPGGARNAGLSATGSAFVAFVDSDCTPPPGWLAALAGHLADPAVAAVAPRVLGQPGRRGLLARYAAEQGPLDLGEREALVRPGGRVSYVPTAALLVRRTALARLAGPQQAPFDASLRYGEDVDLVWRLHDAGWRVRYDPRTVVLHDEPGDWPAWLRRRHRYGTSAGPLARRHGARLTPLVLPAWPSAAWFLLLGGRFLPALLSAGVPAARVHRQLRVAGLPPILCVQVSLRTVGWSLSAVAAGLGGAGGVVTFPVLAALLGARRSRRGAAVALLCPPLLEWVRRRPGVDPVRWVALRLVDDLAYATGVWRSCWTARTLAPVRPARQRPR